MINMRSSHLVVGMDNLFPITYHFNLLLYNTLFYLGSIAITTTLPWGLIMKCPLDVVSL